MPELASPTTKPPFTPPPQVAISTTTTALPKAGDASLANLRITAVEITQGLQDLQNRFPLVEGRRTWVRVHARTDALAAMPDVHAALQGVRNGASLGVLVPEHDPLSLIHDPVRRKHDNTPYFKIPDSWADGTVKFRAWIYQGADTDASNEPTNDDNLFEATVQFHPADPVSFHFFPLYLTEDYDPDGDVVLHTPSDGTLDAYRHATKLLPLGPSQRVNHWTVVGDEDSNWNLSDSEDADHGAPNAALQELHELGGYGERDIFVGMVPSSLDPKWGGISSGAQSVWVRMDNWFDDVNTWQHKGGSILAHEGSHAFGLLHAPCKRKFGSAHPGEEVGGAVDPTFPGSYGWPDCSLAPTDGEGFYGFDPRPEYAGDVEPTILTNNNDTEPPNRAFPWMGYNGSGWLDPYHGCRVLAFLGVPCDPADLGVPAATGPGDGGGIPEPAPGTGGGGPGGIPAHPCLSDEDPCANVAPNGIGDDDVLPSAGGRGDMVVVGFLDPKTGKIEIVRSTHVPEHRSVRAPAAGEATFELVVRAGARVATRQRIEIASSGHGGNDPMARRWFVVRTPFVAGTTSIDVENSTGKILGTRSMSMTTPTIDLDSVSITDDRGLRVAWTSADADGDDTATTVQIRAKGSAVWETVGAHVSGSSYTVARDQLPAGTEHEVRVLVSDGMNTSDAITTSVAGLDVSAPPSDDVESMEIVGGPSGSGGNSGSANLASVDANDARRASGDDASPRLPIVPMLAIVGGLVVAFAAMGVARVRRRIHG